MSYLTRAPRRGIGSQAIAAGRLLDAGMHTVVPTEATA